MCAQSEIVSLTSQPVEEIGQAVIFLCVMPCSVTPKIILNTSESQTLANKASSSHSLFGAAWQLESSPLSLASVYVCGSARDCPILQSHPA